MIEVDQKKTLRGGKKRDIGITGEENYQLKGGEGWNGGKVELTLAYNRQYCGAVGARGKVSLIKNMKRKGGNRLTRTEKGRI